MGFAWDIIKELFPSLKDSAVSGWHAFNTSKRNRQEIFVLKAMTFMPECNWIPPVQYPRYDLATISQNVRLFQYFEACQMHGNPEASLYPTEDEERLVESELKKIERRYGLPALRDPDRARKIESILHNMVESRRLHYYPPNMWGIV
jgi:hypothetical protein